LQLAWNGSRHVWRSILTQRALTVSSVQANFLGKAQVQSDSERSKYSAELQHPAAHGFRPSENVNRGWLTGRCRHPMRYILPPAASVRYDPLQTEGTSGSSQENVGLQEFEWVQFGLFVSAEESAEVGPHGPPTKIPEEPKMF